VVLKALEISLFMVQNLGVLRVVGVLLGVGGF